MSVGEDSPKKLLGSVLVDAGLITPEQLTTALEQQQRSGGKIGFQLVQLGFVSATRLAGFLRENFGVAVVQEDLSERQKAAAMFPRHLAFYYKIAPIKLERKTLLVGVSDLDNPHLLQSLNEVTGFKLEPLILPEPEIRSLLDSGYVLPSHHGIELSSFGDNCFAIVDNSKKIKALTPSQLKNERDVGEWLRSIVAESIRMKSREIFFKPDVQNTEVLFKTESFVPSEFVLPGSLQDDLTYLLLRLAKMDPLQQRKMQRGRFLVQVHDRKVVMVVTATPSIYGTRFLLEMFDERLLKHTFDDVTKLYPEMRKSIEDFLIVARKGMLVITGPEGSGRTSFVYGLLAKSKEFYHNIITLENSIRYPINGIAQIQVDEADMENMLTEVMHQKVDLLVIDSLHSVRAAEAAFLIAARVPTIAVMPSFDSFFAIEWFCKHNLKSPIKAGLLHSMLSPRLVPRACPHCSVPFEWKADEIPELDVPAGVRLKMNHGCDHCRNAETSSSELFFEFFRIDPEIVSWIDENASASILREHARKAGRNALFDTVIQDAFSEQLDMLSILKLRSVL